MNGRERLRHRSITKMLCFFFFFLIHYRAPRDLKPYVALRE